MNRAAGFTLLELLIGLALLGFIMALLFGGFRLAINSWDSVETHAQKTAGEQASLAFVHRLLGKIQPLRLGHLPGKPVAFAGQPERLALVAPITELAGLRTIELAIEPQQGRSPMRRLVLREGPPPYQAAALTDPVVDQEARTLIHDLHDARFDFFGATQPGETAHWHDTWQSAIHLPSLIRLRLVPHDGTPIDLVVATIIDADPATRVRIAGVQSL